VLSLARAASHFGARAFGHPSDAKHHGSKFFLTLETQQVFVMHRVNKRLVDRSGRTRPAAGIALVACLSGLVVAGCLGEDGEGNDPFDYNGSQNGGPGQPGGPNGGPGNQPGGGGAPGGGGDLGPKGVEVIGQNQGVDLGGPTVDGSGNPLPVTELPPLDECTTPAPRLIRRLTGRQFRNSLVDVFGGDNSLPAETILTDPAVIGFHIDADASLVRDLDAELLMNYSEAVADWAIAGNKLGTFITCQNMQPNCQQDFVRNFGGRISRGQFPQERVNAYAGLFTANGNTSFQQGMKLAVMAMIQSPYMLYRRELGQPAGNNEFALSPLEVATQLAYFLTDRPPSNNLIQAAQQNRLSSAADIDREAAALLNTPAAQEAMTRFVQGWLETDGLVDKAKAPTRNLTPELRAAMEQETAELFRDVFANGGGVKELLTANYTFINQPLADFYGIQGPGGTGFAKVDISDGRRDPGLLGHGSFLADKAQPENSSPVQRAFIVRERVLCDELPDVPLNLDTNLKPPAPGATNRERYKTHDENPVCYNCHQLMDPIGFTFEHYDGYGVYRDTEVGKPIDASGALKMVPENSEVPLDGVASLVNYLGELEDVRACVVRFWSYYAYGRDDWESKTCNDHAIRREARAQGNSLRSMLMGILHSPSFTRRGPEQQ
jgi:hypothetical protein